MISKVRPVVKDTGDNSDWFQSWFDSPYYHLFYRERDEKNSGIFLDKLISKLNPPPGSKILDVACGLGTHSVYLNKKGFDVTGFDPSASNILHDKQFENEALNFYLHDPREVFRSNYFDLVIDLNSSFGFYFKERDNVRCIIANGLSLKPGGTFVLDYINASGIQAKGEKKYDLKSEGITFHVYDYVEGNFARREITFSADGKDHRYIEQQALFDKEKIEEFMHQSGLASTEFFGDYNLGPFNPSNSGRLIVVAKKIKS